MTPAPIWRRLAALAYDGLIFAGLCMVAAMTVMLLNQLVAIPNSNALLRAALLLVGAWFFGWFWTHGGQTLGMRAWRLRLQRADGAPIRMPAALLRYGVGLLPLILALYAVARFGPSALTIAAVGYVPCLVDPRKRALQDLVAGTEMVQLPPRSAQLAQPPQRDDHEQQRGQAG